MAKDNESPTVLMRVSKHSKRMADKVQKIVAVESNGEILSKTKSLEVALEEFIDKRED